MRRGKYEWDEKKIYQRIRDGHGQGSGNSYKPWLSVRDVPSKGRSHRILGLKTKRVHHFLSDLEYRFFIQSEWRQDVTDIREQYPLNRDLTFPIALALDIKHPVSKDGTPYVMSTDFLLVLGSEIPSRLRAHTIKYRNALDAPRTLDKLEIERRYWKEKGVEWSIVTEDDIDAHLVRNIETVRQFSDLSGIVDPYPGGNHALLAFFLDGFHQSPETPLGMFCSSLDHLIGVARGPALVVAKHLLAHQILITDMSNPTPLAKRKLGSFRIDTVQLTKMRGLLGFR